jgi:hypothetical protein
LPLREDLPRIPEPWQSQMFYYYETDELSRLAEGKSWTWCEIRPDFVVSQKPLLFPLLSLPHTYTSTMMVYSTIFGPYVD